jgi:enoyl-CoA hydratase/carnithine racemase
MKYDLPDELTVDADAEAKVVILSGAGRAFCAGGDLNWITSFLDDPVARDESIREGAQIIEEMLRFPLPVIAAVNGPAVGLGCSVALLSDIMLISETAYLADPHIAVGLVAGDGGVNMYLSQALGRQLQAGFSAEVATMQSDEHRQRLLDFQRKSNRK